MKQASTRDRYGLGALGVYLALSMLFFGRGLVGHFTTVWVGQRQGDPSAFMWFFTWLPHALGQWRDPTFSDAIWAPSGMSLIWTTWMPLGGLVAWPITRTLGPVAAYNALTLPMIPLAGWSAFLLCRRLTDSWWSSLAGGYLYGFCGYMTFYLWVGDPILLAVFPVPLAILATLRALCGEISARRFRVYLTALLVTMFGISPEVFASMTMFGTMALVLAIMLDQGDTRRRLRALIAPIVASYALAVAILSPYLYYFFSSTAPKGAIWQTFLSSADLLFFLLPSHVSEIGRIAAVRHVLDGLPTTIFVGYTYLGPVLLAIVVAFAWSHWREPLGALLLASMVIIAVAAMGPELIVGGRRVAPMPGALLTALPLTRAAVPVRFVMYLALDASLVVALWLGTSSASLYTKCTAMALAIVFAMPSLSTALWNSADDTPAFFLNGMYRRYLRPGENTVVVPYGWLGNCMTWQAHSDMYFHMAEAWAGMPPHQFERWPAMIALYNGNYLPEPELQLKAFLAAHQVSAVLVDERSSSSPDVKQRQDYATVVAALGPAPMKAGGVLIYRLTSADLAPWRDLKPLDLERRADETRFAALIDATERYLQSSADLARLSPERLEQTGLIRNDWVGGPDIRISNGLWVKGHADGTIEVGTFGSRPALIELAARYRLNTLSMRTIAIPGPAGLEEELELMIM
ncbi:MAG TPA: hypothetical protein VNF49_04685, partial [Candidatus Binataceae bacterium]|nr:hypothetical protein [Candidatus Binataceae bacterium]